MGWVDVGGWRSEDDDILPDALAVRINHHKG